MSAELWKRALEILSLLEGLSPEERDRILEEECHGNDELTSRVLEMYETNRALDEDSEPSPRKPVRPGEFLGQYQVLKLLGEGGMGEVYLAMRTDDASLRVDAVKVLPADQATLDRVARAVREGETLRRLHGDYFPKYRDHGTLPDQRPFLAMEFIDGLPIDEYCHKNALRLKDRLQLFRRVCDAIGTAHRSLILHRDLKPENILVTSDGIPKILDFGIAKEIGSGGSASRTLTAAFVAHFSADYASPEQIASETLTTASDVYSLGALLYQLLTGEVPIHLAPLMPAVDQVQQKIRDEQAIPPSARIAKVAAAIGIELSKKAIQGDLDTIVLKALRKEPSERYESTAELSEDIRRHLEELPILAQKPTLRYRAGKMFRRHWRALGFAATVFLLTVAFAISTALQQQSTARERDKAQRVAGFFERIFDSADPITGTGENISARDLLLEASRKIDDDLLKEPELRATLKTIMSRALLNLGRFEESLKLAEDSLELSSGIGDTQERAKTLLVIGDAHRKMGDYELAKPAYDEALRLRTDRFGPESKEATEVQSQIASLLNAQGKLLEAQEKLESVLALTQNHHGRVSDPTARALSSLASNLIDQSIYSEADTLLREALSIRRSIHGSQHPLTAEALNNLAISLYFQGQYEEMEATTREALSIIDGNLGTNHIESVMLLNSLSHAQKAQGKFSEASEAIERAISIQERVLGESHPDLAMSLSTLGNLLKRTGNLDEAAIALQRSLQIRRSQLGNDHTLTAISLNDLGLILLEQGSVDAAEGPLREAMALRDKLHGPVHRETAVVQSNLAKLLIKKNDLEGAQDLYRQALETMKALFGERHPNTATLMNNLGTALMMSGDLLEAEQLLSVSLDLREELLGPKNVNVAITLERLAKLQNAKGDHAQAIESAERALTIAEEALPKGHRDILTIAITLGRSRIATGDFVGAEKVLLGQLNSSTDVAGATSSDNDDIHQALVELYGEWGKPVLAAQYRSQK